MSRTSIEITAAALKGFLLVIPKEDVRTYLCGLHVDFPNGRIVATDGHRLIVKKIEPNADGPVATIPRALIEQVTRLKSPDANVVISLWGETEQKPDAAGEVRDVTVLHAELCRGSGIYRAKDIESRYPEIARVIPKRVSGKLGQFNAEYLADCSEALSAIANVGKFKFPAYVHNGPDNAGVMFFAHEPSLLAVIMPMRDGADTTTDANKHLQGFAPVDIPAESVEPVAVAQAA
jgi:diadenosine tetraphosphate (Ap4A) HIT family hydrolase